MANIFISYSHQDQAFTNSLGERLRRIYGYDNVWIDDRLQGGDVWWREIVEQITTADIILFMLSDEAIQSEYCRDELREALNKGKPVIPIRVREISPAVRNAKGFERWFARIEELQIIDMAGGITEDKFDSLHAAINHNLPDTTPESTPIIVQQKADRMPLILVTIMAVVAIVFGTGVVIDQSTDIEIPIINNIVNIFTADDAEQNDDDSPKITMDGVEGDCTLIDFGTSADNSIDQRGESDCYAFRASAGNRVRIQVGTDGSLRPQIRVFNSNNLGTIDTVTSDPCQAETSFAALSLICSLATDDVYRIVVEDKDFSRVGEYSVSVRQLNNTTACSDLSDGIPQQGNITGHATSDCYTFTASASDRIRIKIGTDGNLDPQFQLYDSMGLAVMDAETSSACREGTAFDALSKLCLLEADDTYTLVVEDNDFWNFGEYAVTVQRMNDTALCDAISFEAPLTERIAEHGESDCYIFTASENDRIRIQMSTDGELNPRFRLYGSDGLNTVDQETSLICGEETGFDSFSEVCLLDEDDTYVLVVEDSQFWQQGDYNLAIRRLNDTTACIPLTFATPQEGSIDAIAASDCYTFTASENDRIRVQMSTDGELDPQFRLYSSNGRNIYDAETSALCGADSAFNALSSTCLLDTDDTYTLLVEDDQFSNVGEYAFSVNRLNDTTDCNALEFNTPQSGRIDASAQSDCYTFAAAAGDRIRIQIGTDDNLEPQFRLYRANGQPAIDAGTSNPCRGDTIGSSLADSCLIEANDTYTLYIEDDAFMNVGDYAVSIRNLNDGEVCDPLSFDTPESSQIAEKAQSNCYRFEAAAGDQIGIQIRTDGILNPQFRLYRANDLENQKSSLCFADSTTTSLERTCDIEVDDTYLLLIEDNRFWQEGNYTLSVQLVNE